MSCDADMQYKLVLILQSDWTRLYAAALHKLIYGTFPDSVACEKSGNETSVAVWSVIPVTTSLVYSNQRWYSNQTAVWCDGVLDVSDFKLDSILLILYWLQESEAAARSTDVSSQ